MKEWQIHGNHSSAGNLPAISKQEISDLLPKTIEASQTPVLIRFLAEYQLAFIQIVIQPIRPYLSPSFFAPSLPLCSPVFPVPLSLSPVLRTIRRSDVSFYVPKHVLYQFHKQGQITEVMTPLVLLYKFGGVPFHRSFEVLINILEEVVEDRELSDQGRRHFRRWCRK